MGNLQSWDFYEFHFGAARLKHYLAESHDVQSQAMLLYEWNSDISAAFWGSLGHLEVGLRNAIDRQMNLRHEAKGRSGNWIFDDSRELGRNAGRGQRNHAYPYADIDTAISRVRRNRMPIDPGQVISEISFGFWHQMVSKSQMFLWPDLVAAFPYMKGRNQLLASTKVGELRELRNRIGHHHRIWASDLDQKFEDLVALAGYIHPDFGRGIKVESRVPLILSERPI
ncbi:hypothetical protein [Glutamicibacter sp. M10]|uniref:hypothetical protein n=1 Tax=Glutamicibacter sp. M10 TaxID=3023076 RepID=UPI0021C7B93F|nr:hypothetical protein [Glutamicibacter sp. M10]UXN32780.1 hypothetical protein N6V40_04840 [Glutamicibacter sp. M10]